MKKTLVSAALAAAMLLGAAPATAQDRSAYLVFVPYGDLDLTTAAGQRALDNRLRDAARRTCGAPTARLAEREVARDCRASFRDAGIPKIEQALARREQRRTMLAAR